LYQTATTSVNKRAMSILERAIKDAQDLGISVIKKGYGVTLLDMGVVAPGSWEAGRIFAEAAMGGMGSVTFGECELAGGIVPSVVVHVDNPPIACMSSHVAGWKIDEGRFSPIAGGPVRAIRGLDKFAQSITYRDDCDQGVATLQMPELPSDDLLRKMMEIGGVKHLYVLVARTASLVGMIQVCARTVEQVVPTLWDHGFDITRIAYGVGHAPLPPLVNDELEALGRVNDALIYGNDTTVTVRCSDEEIVRPLDESVFRNNEWYGHSFKEIFEAFDCDWYKVPRGCDAPAKIGVINARTGHYFSSGCINTEILERSFFGRG
jgi:methenyltetrahydromethanopterin cyclohydrolase